MPRGVAGTSLTVHLQASVDAVDRRGCSPLMVAASMGHEEAVAALFDAGGELDRQDQLGSTGLMLAASQGETDTVARLVQSGASTEPQDRDRLTAVGLSGLYGHVEATEILIEAGESNIAEAAKQHQASIHRLVQTKIADQDGSLVGSTGARLEVSPPFPLFSSCMGARIDLGVRRRGSRRCWPRRPTRNL